MTRTPDCGLLRKKSKTSQAPPLPRPSRDTPIPRPAPPRIRTSCLRRKVGHVGRSLQPRASCPRLRCQPQYYCGAFSQSLPPSSSSCPAPWKPGRPGEPARIPKDPLALVALPRLPLTPLLSLGREVGRKPGGEADQVPLLHPAQPQSCPGSWVSVTVGP